MSHQYWHFHWNLVFGWIKSRGIEYYHILFWLRDWFRTPTFTWEVRFCTWICWTYCVPHSRIHPSSARGHAQWWLAPRTAPFRSAHTQRHQHHACPRTLQSRTCTRSKRRGQGRNWPLLTSFINLFVLLIDSESIKCLKLWQMTITCNQQPSCAI